ncbi:hypothetical protein ILUMI_06694 [Ignelater luminosus]|uniref:HAT C-terminal dimerisation domain-containing protein n=1 Tax=Ignelater luminosus TaxID=2038154 RepID=A0A8K0D9R4_IGNLU|nr:hypothetical protein ILUMI_06694 [Ignelater luminosus]
MDVATNMFTSLDDFIINLRDKFDYFESSAKKKNPESDYKDLSQRIRGKNSRQAVFDDSASSVQLNGREEFKSSENEETNSLSGIHHRLKENKIEGTFPNVEIALRIFLSMMVTNCSGERSFSKLKRIKNELRSTMLQERLTSLSLMPIECDALKDIDFEEVIDDFAYLKCRRRSLLAGLDTCSTARKNRKGMSNDLKGDKVLKSGDSDWRVSTKGVICLKWIDRKSVLFLGNYHNPASVKTFHAL